ncbi:LacI family DNA-binding transcriptional regulator [Streptomyces sp. NPDC088745]|uniref:LacI family DNA-binding transcriptional regulator n=1 Tax=Streptomyces sp. NPDC088745 TaxID=3365884 RepID=UPI003821FC1F
MPTPAHPARTAPTSRDVARAAGVSQATVSLVLGDKWQGRVSPRTAALVRGAADDLGYRPNQAARSLRLGNTRTALLVVPALTNEFFARVYTGAAATAAEHGFGVVLYPSPDGTGPARDPFASARTALDGVIASSMATHALGALRGTGLPLVMLDSYPTDTHDPADTTDPDADDTDATATHATGRHAAAHVNLAVADGMHQVAHHLLGLGHRRFLHLASAVDTWTFHVRARALAETLPPGTTTLRTVHSALDVHSARTALENALTTGTDRPTAVICDDDVLAAGACKALRRLGLRVPDDISVTGFDDLALATAVEPELTTVRLPAEQVGRSGMAALLAVLEGHTPDNTELPVELVTRGSTAAPAKP